MNTTAAALEAHVGADTVRTWCRIGAVAAVKKAGRWVIDQASLAARIAIGRMKRPAKPVAFSIETMTAIGGRRWQKNGMDRVYINDWHQFTDIEVHYFGTGSVSYAEVNGRQIANGRALALLGAIEKVWFDTADGLLHFRHRSAEAYEIRYKSGGWDYLDLVEAATSGIRTAIAAL